MACILYGRLRTGSETVPRIPVSEVSEFNEGKESLSECPRPGRPKSCVNEQTIASIKKDIDEDPHISVRELSDTNGLLYGTVHTTKTEYLCMKVRCATELLSMFEPHGPKRFSDIVTGDETWFPFFIIPPKHLNSAKTQSLWELGIQVLPHPAYSSDLAPCNFWLFPILKDRLAGRMFDRIQDLAKAVNSELRAIPEEDYQGVFRK
ncbi:transposase [Elysia marginata]|uniref:Transposase n=1 Tax=Elysia marginata TaxID=1093978 RepID=A0AAV4IJ77_9GAST|nr:transposase [Elysia marginata]